VRAHSAIEVAVSDVVEARLIDHVVREIRRELPIPAADARCEIPYGGEQVGAEFGGRTPPFLRSSQILVNVSLASSSESILLVANRAAASADA
jgi:hypothetical protein